MDGRRLLRGAMALIAPCAVIAVLAFMAEQEPSNQLIAYDAGAALERELPLVTGTDQPGYILRVMDGQTVLFERATGMADIEQGRLITSESVFHIASLSKQITAAALAHAISDGLVSLDDPVGRWVPEAQVHGDALTVAHLVYMTSGLAEYTLQPGPGGRPWATFHYFTNEDAIAASLAVEDLKFEPGTQWDYSNTNYMLIARIVSEAYGAPFGEVVDQRLFKPLGMTASLVNDDTTTLIPNRANAYAPRQDAVLSELASGAQVSANPGPGLLLIRRNAPHYGGSGVMTSMDDWSKWLAELTSHQVFGEDFWTLMMRHQAFDHPKTNDAFGLVIHEVQGHRVASYSGGDIDASTYSLTFLDSGLSIACFANTPFGACEDKVRLAIEILAEHGTL